MSAPRLKQAGNLGAPFRIRTRSARHRPASPSRIHAARCRCRRCDPPRLTGQQRAVRVLLGLAIGQLAVVAIDAAIGGPGPFTLFGL